MATDKPFWRFWRLVRAKGIRGFMTPLFGVLWLNGAENWSTVSIRWGWEFYFWPSAFIVREGMTHYRWRWDFTYGVSEKLISHWPKTPLATWKKIAKSGDMPYIVKEDFR